MCKFSFDNSLKYVFGRIIVTLSFAIVRHHFQTRLIRCKAKCGKDFIKFEIINNK